MEDKRKKRRLKQIIIGLLIFFALGFAFRPVTAKADFGDFSGDTDYGGGDYDSGGWDSDDYSSDYSSGSSSGGGGFSVVGLVIVIIS